MARVLLFVAVATISASAGFEASDVDELVQEIEKKGFVSALVDWGAAKEVALTDALTVFLQQGRTRAGRILEQRQCTFPPDQVQSCSCFEIFNMAELWIRRASVDEEEYKQRFKRAAKLYHPDKVGGSGEHMVHLKACSTLLRKPSLAKVRKEYIVELRKAFQKCRTQAERRAMSHGECYRSEVEMLHDCDTGICLSNPKFISGQIAKHGMQEDYTEKGIMERLVLLIDDSFSMTGWKLESAKAALASIMPRIERTPTDTHFIRSRGGPEGFVSTQIFGQNDSAVTYEDIARHWKACCLTYLWEYAHGAISAVTSPLIEVVILTDGEDNDSEGKFHGAEGFSHMMELLLLTGKQPRFRIYCIGNDACMGKNLYYRDLALATGGTFVSVGSDTNATAKLAGVAAFAEECNAPFVERQQRSLDARNQYRVLLLEGGGKKYDWADTLKPELRSSVGARESQERASEL